MLLVFGFFVLVISFIIAFLSLISEEKKHRRTVLEQVSTVVAPKDITSESKIVSKQDIVKMAQNSQVVFEVPPKEEALSNIAESPQIVQKPLSQQAFPWEEDNVSQKEESLLVQAPTVQTGSRDSLFGEFKMPRDEK